MLHFAKVVLGSYALSRLYWNACAAESTGTERHSHGAVITPAPTLRNQLQRRSIATCAYVRGNSALPLTCPDGYNCINSLAIQPAWACCNDIECLGNWGLCNEYGASGCGGVNLDTNLCSSIYRAPILQCSQANPHCFRYARSSRLGAQETYYSWACGTDSTDVLALVSVTNGNNNPNPDPTSENFLSIPGLTSNINLPTDPPVAGQTPSTGSSKKSPLSITTIVLISLFVGGVLVIALIIGCCCLWKKHRTRKQQLRYGVPPANMPYTPTVTNGYGSIYSWNLQVPSGTTPSTLSGPTANSYPLSEISYGPKR